jgi:hypothetical protein
LVLVTAAVDAKGALELAYALGAALARPDRAALVGALDGSRPKSSLLASAAARELASRTDGLFEAVVPRGHVAAAGLPAEASCLAELASTSVREGAAAVVAWVPGPLWSDAVAAAIPHASVLQAELPRDRSLAALWVRSVRRRGARAFVAARPLGKLASRRARAGVVPTGADGARVIRLARRIGAQAGQALPALLGAVFALVAATSVLAAMVGAATGKGRAQRAADLSALSAARSMRDDFARLFVSPRLPNGRPNPRHLAKSAYLARATSAGLEAARQNGGGTRIRIDFPDRASIAPLRVRTRLLAGGPAARPSDRASAVVAAVAEADPGPVRAPPRGGSGGGYEGRLVYRQGKPMRPDVAAAFDRMARAAARAGHPLIVSSAFRSDAEQARIFAANPDPRWVARPGRSLHRCGTELDLGPPGAYAWLAANAGRFGFVKRYAWEPWHFGYDRGPSPCSAAGSVGGDGSGSAPNAGLPGFVPAAFRGTVERAAARWNVSAALLAAQLMVESNFNPFASSPAGARGIAQFMPGTAAAYRLDDPFDPDEAIDAQAHLMADLLREFRSVPLALAAYNAGAAAVRRYGGMPPYAETRAYVARILGLIGASGEVFPTPLEVRLVS